MHKFRNREEKNAATVADIFDIIRTAMPLGPDRPLSPGIPAGPCYTHRQ